MKILPKPLTFGKGKCECDDPEIRKVCLILDIFLIAGLALVGILCILFPEQML